eukprot:scaffold23938_cov31-Tisochrysis_lutea.AAC.3
MLVSQGALFPWQAPAPSPPALGLPKPLPFSLPAGTPSPSLARYFLAGRPPPPGGTKRGVRVGQGRYQMWTPAEGIAVCSVVVIFKNIVFPFLLAAGAMARHAAV